MALKNVTNVMQQIKSCHSIFLLYSSYSFFISQLFIFFLGETYNCTSHLRLILQIVFIIHKEVQKRLSVYESVKSVSLCGTNCIKIQTKPSSKSILPEILCVLCSLTSSFVSDWKKVPASRTFQSCE